MSHACNNSDHSKTHHNMASQMVHSRPSMRTQLPQRYARTAVCVRASEEPQRSTLDKATALIGAASLALLLSASAPDPAMAARSGGRAGGSSFSRAPSMRSRPAPSAPAPRAQGGYAPPYCTHICGATAPVRARCHAALCCSELQRWLCPLARV